MKFMEKENGKYHIRHKVWIENIKSETLLGDGKWELLKLIDATGSLKAAIEKMGWGYRSTWNKLKTIEKRIEFPIIERSRGGAGGGGQSILTEKGKMLVDSYRELHYELEELLKEPFHKFIKKLEHISSE
jgi:molybdate transport system regulatory protein